MPLFTRVRSWYQKAAAPNSDLSSILDPGKRFVVFKAFVKGSYLVLDMRNSKSTSEGDEGRETTRRGILDRIRFAEEQTSGGSLAEHGWGLSVVDTIVQRYEETVERIDFGDTPRSRTPLPPTRRLPSQCIMAPVW